MAKMKKKAKKLVAKSKKNTRQKIKKNTMAKAKKRKVLAVPHGYNSITPYLIVRNAANAIEFYKKVFGAKEVMRMEKPGGKIGHAEVRIGDTKIMLADEHPEMSARSPESYGGSPVGIHLYIKDVDAILQKAMAAGATLLRPATNMFYGDRIGTVKDPYGHTWSVATHVEDVSAKEMKKRAAAMYAG